MLKKISFTTSLIALALLIYFALKVNNAIPTPKLEKQDVYYSYLEGQRLLQGENPYARILDGDMRLNKKYATYFPLFYEISALSQKIGLQEYPRWIYYWMIVFRGFELAIGVLLYTYFAQKKMEWGGIVAAGFWLFNRWGLRMIATANLDYIPIFFALAALLIFPRKKWLSLLLFSLSLALKQIGIFMAPLFVIWVFQQEQGWPQKIRQALVASGIIASVPLLSSLPFLFWNAEGLIKSILFSATRFADNHFAAESLDVLMGWQGPAARIPMLLLFLGVYLLAFYKKEKRFSAVMLIFIIFVTFNSVLYEGYMTWLVAFIPLLVDDLRLDETTPATTSP